MEFDAPTVSRVQEGERHAGGDAIALCFQSAGGNVAFCLHLLAEQP